MERWDTETGGLRGFLGHLSHKYAVICHPESHFLATVGELQEDPEDARTLTSYSVVSISWNVAL